MQRFFVKEPLWRDMVIADPDLHHQMGRVLRMTSGDQVILFDGDRSETLYTITAIDKKHIYLHAEGRSFPDTEPKKIITLYQALPNKIEKIEYILQKWVEVGIRRFVFFRAEHSQKLMLSDAKKERLETIAREAVEQCGWLLLPEIVWSEGEVPVFSEKNIVLDTIGTRVAIRTYDSFEEVAIHVGPEWGWSMSERDKMREKGFIFAHIGSRILRTETMGVVMAFSLLNG